MDRARILAFITGTVDQELLSGNEYLVTENHILKRQLKGRLLLSEAERATLGESGHRLGRKALADLANTAKPDTILGWYAPGVARPQIAATASSRVAIRKSALSGLKTMGGRILSTLPR